MEITDLKAAILPHPSIVRMKLFTLDERFVLRKAGGLGATDRAAVQRRLQRLRPFSA